MIVEAEVTVRGDAAKVWAAITDIEHAAALISGVVAIEIVERPARGLVGLRWRETRMFQGEPATVEKRITEATDGASYTTLALHPGFEFLTTHRIERSDGGVRLIAAHETRPQGLVAKLQMIPMRLFFRGMLRKLIQQDLEDLKRAVERG